MLGNRDSVLQSNPRYALDESLARPVAQALASVGIPILSVIDIFGRPGATDDEILTWCRKEGGIWIHADDRRHRRLLREGSGGARTVWVFRLCGKMRIAEQLRILAVVLPRLEDRIDSNPSILYYIASAASVLATPKLTAARR